MACTHSHYCKHCDRTWSCLCGEFVYDVSFLHDCFERFKASKQIKAILEGAHFDREIKGYVVDSCPIKCTLNCCPHVPKETLIELGKFKFWQNRVHEKFRYYYEDTNPLDVVPA